MNRFSVNGDSPNKKHYTLSNDDYVWEVLAGCENAPFVEDEKWVAHDREYYSFTITSETLGVYKVAMYVTADGYLWTNAFNYQYLFNIGEDAAGKIIKYAKENSTEAEYEPYLNTIVGKITEITDEYILLDDSVLCTNPDDGITYKILLKKGKDKYVDDKTAFAYGAGHGGFEAFYILVVSMITNLIFGVMINTGNTELLFTGLDEAKLAATENVLNQLVTLSPWTFLVSVVERFGAVTWHMAASVLVWFAVKNKKFWLYPLAILLHLVLDMLAVIGMQFGVPIALIEVFLYLYSAACIFFAWKVWKKESC